MKNEVFKNLTKQDFYSFLVFLLGYIISVLDEKMFNNFVIIFSNMSIIVVTILNLIYILFLYLIIKSITKKYYLFKITYDMQNKNKLLILLKTFLIGYFFGFLSIIGNSFIKTIFDYII